MLQIKQELYDWIEPPIPSRLTKDNPTAYCPIRFTVWLPSDIGSLIRDVDWTAV